MSVWKRTTGHLMHLLAPQEFKTAEKLQQTMQGVVNRVLLGAWEGAVLRPDRHFQAKIPITPLGASLFSNRLKPNIPPQHVHRMNPLATAILSVMTDGDLAEIGVKRAEMATLKVYGEALIVGPKLPVDAMPVGDPSRLIDPDDVAVCSILSELDEIEAATSVSPMGNKLWFVTMLPGKPGRSATAKDREEYAARLDKYENARALLATVLR